jgi:hypothetical protein
MVLAHTCWSRYWWREVDITCENLILKKNMEIVVSLLAVLTISIKITQLKAIVDTLIKCIKNLENGLYYTTLLYDTLGLFWRFEISHS